MISHNEAQRLLDRLEGDVEVIEKLEAYITHQGSLERMDNPSVARVADAAERRAVEAIARVVTLSSDLTRAIARIEALEASGADLLLALIELADKLETLSPS